MHIVLASAIGAPMNPSKIANTFAGERQMIYSNKTISNHIDYLADAFLISKANTVQNRQYRLSAVRMARQVFLFGSGLRFE